MIGAIIGDTVGSRFEFNNIDTKEFEFLTGGCSPTDDSIMTIALADAILQWDSEGRPSYDRLSDLSADSMRKWGNKYPHAGYGGLFRRWLTDWTMGPYKSCGNGAAMRVSPVGWAAKSLEDCIAMSYAVTKVTHNHFDGIKGAESTAVQIFLAGQGYDMRELAEYQEEHYYKIEYNVKWLIDNYTWCSLCDGTCQAAFQCLYESTDFEDAIRNCMAIGGDCDTTGAICGGIAEAVYGVPDNLRQEIRSFLDDSQLSVIDEFCERFV